MQVEVPVDRIVIKEVPVPIERIVENVITKEVIQLKREEELQEGQKRKQEVRDESRGGHWECAWHIYQGIRLRTTT